MIRSRVVGGRYLLLAELERHGAGPSFRAEDRITGRQVAVTEVRFAVRPGHGGVHPMRERLLAEVRAAGRIRHPGVVPVQDLITERHADGTLRDHLVTGLPDALPLSALLADGPLPPRRVAGIGRDLLAALRAVHDSGVPHGGLTPDCVLVADTGEALVTDVGLVRAIGRTDGAARAADGFIAPEQRAGGPDSPAADLWSLGAVLHHAAGRRPPASGPLAAAITGLAAADPADRLSVAEADALLERAARPGPTTGDLGRSRTLLLVVAGILLVAVAVMIALALG